MTPRLGNLLTYEAHTGSWGQNWKYRIWVIIWEGCRDAKVKQIGKKKNKHQDTNILGCSRSGLDIQKHGFHTQALSPSIKQN